MQRIVETQYIVDTHYEKSPHSEPLL